MSLEHAVEGRSELAMDKCPGNSSFVQPKPECVLCPSCGAEVEIWTDEVCAFCLVCHAAISRGLVQSCLDWCQHAEKCLESQRLRRNGVSQ